MWISFWICSLLSMAALLRIVPYFLSPAGAGVDHWFWKKYIETYRTNRQFPPVLSQYLLDQHQWYPPLFPFLMMKLPTKLFDRSNHILAIVFDLIRMLLLLFIALWLSGGDLRILIFSGIIYATTPIQISYNFQLNPRGLAALMLDTLLIFLLWFYSFHGPWWAWLFVICLSGLILLTHKMTTQLFWFICICCTLIYHDWYFLLLIPSSMIMAIVLSKGFYIKVLIAHIDIVKFWSKHWRWIGADAIRESPLYGEENYHRQKKLHQSGIKGFLWHCFILFGFNPASWIACLLLFERLFIEPHVLIYSSWLIFWLLIPCLLSALTTFVPLLRCIGAGYLYLYNTSLITSLLLAMALEHTKWAGLSITIYSTALCLNILGVFMFYHQFYKNKRSRIDKSFNNIIEKLNSLPAGTVWCIPSAWHEPIAYKTKHQVLWGGHGYGFKKLTLTFPRLLAPVQDIIAKYNISYLLTMRGLLTEKFLKDIDSAEIIEQDEYELYLFKKS